VGEQIEAPLQASEERLRGEDLGAGSGQFDGQRQPIQPPADSGYNRGVVGREGKLGVDGSGAENEQADRIGISGIVRGTGCVIGYRQRRHRELTFAGDAQRRAAGSEHHQIGAGGEQVGDGGGGLYHLLEVVEHQ